MSGHSPEEIRASVRVYVKVFVALAILTGLTVGASYLPFNEGSHITVALIIAAVKASLVALFFMHLKGEVSTIFRALVLTGLFFVFLIALPLSSLLDHTGASTETAPTHHAEAAEGH